MRNEKEDSRDENPPFVTNEQHMRLDMKMPYLSLAYNLQWGRQKRSPHKIINADAPASTSTPASR